MGPVQNLSCYQHLTLLDRDLRSISLVGSAGDLQFRPHLLWWPQWPQSPHSFYLLPQAPGIYLSSHIPSSWCCCHWGLPHISLQPFCPLCLTCLHHLIVSLHLDIQLDLSHSSPLLEVCPTSRPNLVQVFLKMMQATWLWCCMYALAASIIHIHTQKLQSGHQGFLRGKKQTKNNSVCYVCWMHVERTKDNVAVTDVKIWSNTVTINSFDQLHTTSECIFFFFTNSKC